MTNIRRLAPHIAGATQPRRSAWRRFWRAAEREVRSPGFWFLTLAGLVGGAFIAAAESMI